MGDSGDKKPGALPESPAFPGADGLKKQRREKKPGNRRALVVASLALLAALAAGGVYLARHIEPGAAPAPTSAPSPAKALVAVAKADLMEATVSIGEDSYTIEALEAGGYGMKGAPGFAVSQAKASNLAFSLTSLRYDDVITAPGALSAYGLAEPAAVVTARYRDGSARTFLLGDQTPSGAYYYLKEEGGQDVYIVYAEAAASFTATRSQMHVAQLPQVAAENIWAVSLAPRGQAPIEVALRDNVETLGVSTLWLTSPVLYEADSMKVESYYANIESIRLRGFEVDATQETLPKYGLDDPRYRLAVFTQDAQGNPVTALELFIGDDKDGESTYARIDDTADVYLLDRASLAFLADVSAAKLIDQFANIINIAKVDSFTVSRQDGTSHLFTITRAPELDAGGNPKANAGGQPIILETFALNGQPIPDATFRKLYQIIIGLRVDGMIPEGKAPEPGAEPVLTVSYRLNAIREEERIEYLPYDADHYALRRNGTVMFYILKTRVDMISRAIETYENGTFDPAAFGV